MEFKQLIQGLDVLHIRGENRGDVSRLCFSADQCTAGSMFVAIPGFKNDGHDFIAQAVAAGAKFIIHEKDFAGAPGVTAVKVSDSRRALGILSKNFFGHPSKQLTLIAVTGTNGKTTVTYLLESILKEAGCSCGVLGTVNYRYCGRVYPAPNTTPESYDMQRILRDMADEGVTHVVAEVSSHAVDLKRVDDCDFDMGIFTNLSRDHLDYHLTIENYFQAKKRFFTDILAKSSKGLSRKMVVNADNVWGQRLLQEVSLLALTYGVGREAEVRALNYELSVQGLKAQIRFGEDTFFVRSSLIGKFNLYNVLAASGAAFLLSLPVQAIQRGIEKLSSVPGRLEAIHSSAGFSVFVDYAHTDDALRHVLQSLGDMKKSRIITVFGCGGNRDRGKRPLMGAVASQSSDVTIVTSDNPRLEDPMEIIADIEKGIDRMTVRKVDGADIHGNAAKPIYTIIPDRRKAIETAIRAAAKDDIILIAGKGHENYQIVGAEKLPFDDREVVRQLLATNE